MSSSCWIAFSAVFWSYEYCEISCLVLDWQIYREIMQLFKKGLFLIKFQKINPYSMIVTILHTFWSSSGFFNPGIPWIWPILVGCYELCRRWETFISPCLLSHSWGNINVPFVIHRKFLIPSFAALRLMKELSRPKFQKWLD